MALGLAMSNIELNVLKNLDFKDPRSFLLKLRCSEEVVSQTDTSKNIKNLRVNGLKQARETRDAALFCYGMSKVIGETVYFSMCEAQDYDFVAKWRSNSIEHLARVQLKEVVPKALNTAASLDTVISQLSKYVDSADLVVAIRLNQITRFEPDFIVVPSTIKIGELWVFGSITEDQSEWRLWGNFLGQLGFQSFGYPT